MQGTITIKGTQEEGVFIIASLQAEDILDKSYIKDIINRLFENEKKEDKENE